MRSYELMFIVDPEVEGEAFDAVTERVKELIERQEGQIIHVDLWGTRPLAYPIRKKREGQYVVMQFELASPSQGIAHLERDLLLVEPIMRHLIVRNE